MCDLATARPQFGSLPNSQGHSFYENQHQIPVGTTDGSGKTWSSISRAVLKTEAILRRSAPVELREAKTFKDAMDALQAMGLDVVLTASASDDALMMDERWEVIGSSNETGVILNRYLRSCNAVLSVKKNGSIEIISQDEMSDERYAQTVIYRVDNLVSNYMEGVALAQQIEQSLWTEIWEKNGGCSTIQPRVQSGHRLLIVSIHYQYHVGLRQFFHELSASSRGRHNSGGRSFVVGIGAAPMTSSSLVAVPGLSNPVDQSSRGSMVLGVPQAVQTGGMF